MIEEQIKEQNQFLSDRRIEGHSYEIEDKDNGRVWLYDLNDTTGGGIEEFEEIEFPKDLYEMAKNGDKFLYKNGLYTKNHESNKLSAIFSHYSRKIKSDENKWRIRHFVLF